VPEEKCVTPAFATGLFPEMAHMIQPVPDQKIPAISLRILIAVIGGYALANVLGAAIALVLTPEREGAAWGALASYPAYVAAIAASFGIRSLRHLTWGYAGCSLLLAALIAFLKLGAM
jgi:hypothetical protein